MKSMYLSLLSTCPRKFGEQHIHPDTPHGHPGTISARITSTRSRAGYTYSPWWRVRSATSPTSMPCHRPSCWKRACSRG